MAHFLSEPPSRSSMRADDCLGAATIEPAQAPAISIRQSSNRIGLGVFAETNISHGSLIFQERPVFEATHDNYCDTCLKDGPATYKALPLKKKALMQAAFRPIANADQIPLQKAYEILPEIGKMVRQPTIVEFDVTLDQYMSSTSSASSLRWPTQYDKQILKFVRLYAFRAPEDCGKGRHGAYIYLIGSLINHKCSKFNCNFSFQDGEIRVIARADIKKGEELSINYGIPAFDCFCEECDDLRKSNTHYRLSCTLS
ncbi:hypothetical protein PpBr36_00123 [Pyricularia pennisetigena]|uniref:hypothetical protein n=1 Tax=Pyricularia pennisetigena TaxID=1578925 RepID=UPI0011534F64|nr:hypothetical protein PpBr36_00123 [Pyricularia pennisetigena]TLS29238.1 hypothetical protein PpBr36_00123 [Pyricularia pennisetigena]